jgi:hypothetical protein
MSTRLPSQTETFNFIVGTHAVDRVPLTGGDVANTYSGKATIPNPYADGHLQAVNFVFSKLVGKADFPARDPKLLTNRFKSDLALAWLKELNSLMLSPLLSQHAMASADPNPPQRQFIGVWRPIPAMNTFSYAPDPGILPRCMHVWLTDVATLNDEVKGKLDMSYGISRETAHRLERTAYESNLFIATAQPFVNANNRLGRLVENALRLHWRLPWKGCQRDHDYEKYTENLVTYQQEKLPGIVKQATQLSGPQWI